MSLFPAYAEQAKAAEDNKEDGEQSWLENSSFQISSHYLHKNEDETQVERCKENSKRSAENTGKIAKKKRRKHKKEDREKQKIKIKQDLEKDSVETQEDFVLDTKPCKEFLTVKTISRPAAPKYRVEYYLTSRSARQKKKFKRYYSQLFIDKNPEKSNSEDEKVLTKKDLNSASFDKRDENFTGFHQEEELSKTTANFNKTLGETPNDVKTWLEYVNFQDSIYNFEKTYRKGSIAKAQRVLAERKIAIIDKALSHNPECDELLRERLRIAVSVFPNDELQLHLKKLVENEQGNIILWQGFIEATQCSMSHCNTPAVIALYSKCLSTLHRLRRTSAVDKHVFEENILKMLYQCGLFLKQAGLFEQLWTMLSMYLELNLSPEDKNKFNIPSRFNEKQLVDLEEVVFNSRLPLHELWLRTEKLRESCHWLPHSQDADCEDPQRIVFAEDVAELIHPVTVPENTFKMVATILTLLKVPLLPCRHSTMQELGLDYVPWSLDSIEALLPVFMPTFPVDTTNVNLLKDSGRLAVGPQYLKVLPGQEEYLEFILILMENCADCLKSDDQIAITIWWFRFQRLLIILDKQGRFKMASYFKTKMKKNMKNLLKKHRNNEMFYLEYGLIQYELGNVNDAITVIETALSIVGNNKIVTNNWEKSQENQCNLVRNIVEITVDGSKTDGLKHLLKYILQRNVTEITKGILMEAETKFRNVKESLLQTDFPKEHPVKHFLPDFPTDFIICNGWFLYLSDSPNRCIAFIDNVLKNASTLTLWQREVLHEFYVAILYKNCTENPIAESFRALDVVLFEAVETFPNNLFLLSVLAKQESVFPSKGTQLWKLQKLLLGSGRAISTVFAVVIATMHKEHFEANYKDTITGKTYEISSSFKYRMMSLFKRIVKSDKCTRRCGLAWRLYLQFVHGHFDLNVCRNVYYSAVEECPWLKALYIDAAIYIPAELSQIQDLIIEKQLRLHVTPEELDILRS